MHIPRISIFMIITGSLHTMEILDLLNEESVSGAHSGRASLKFDEKSYCECLRVPRHRPRRHPRTN